MRYYQKVWSAVGVKWFPERKEKLLKKCGFIFSGDVIWKDVWSELVQIFSYNILYFLIFICIFLCIMLFNMFYIMNIPCLKHFWLFWSNRKQKFEKNKPRWNLIRVVLSIEFKSFFYFLLYLFDVLQQYACMTDSKFYIYSLLFYVIEKSCHCVGAMQYSLFNFGRVQKLLCSLVRWVGGGEGWLTLCSTTSFLETQHCKPVTTILQFCGL